MDFYNNKMEEALAEILGVSLDTVDTLNITIEENIGHDDFLYGYYVEFPQREDIDKDLLSKIESQDLDKIPWGKTEYYSESKFSNTSVDPFGYRAELEYETYLQEHIPSKENIINQLNKFKDIISSNDDEIIIKSLTLSSFSMAESYVKHLVWLCLPDNLKEDISIIKKLKNSKDRIDLYFKHSGKKLKHIPFFKDVRHPLAHNIIEPTVCSNQLKIINEKNEYAFYDITQIIEDLKTFIENPIEK